jgi:putative addiction module component (TIGR02574 family)
MPRISLSQLLHLSPTERIHLAEELWDSVAAHPEQVKPPPEQLAELERRLAELDENPEEGEPWDQVKARITSSLEA